MSYDGLVLMASGWTGGDPQLRALRTIAVLVILGLMSFVVITPDARDPATFGTLVGALLIALGFEAGIRWPRR